MLEIMKNIKIKGIKKLRKSWNNKTYSGQNIKNIGGKKKRNKENWEKNKESSRKVK